MQHLSPYSEGLALLLKRPPPAPGLCELECPVQTMLFELGGIP